ncbi:alpha/beta hydrolase [Nocardia sp. CNY236]|uniref:alpha/beta hydrolase n=1 Tax=Nocardia sp. CNY236 TaxID=1169152 RepID=UPI003510A449
MGTSLDPNCHSGRRTIGAELVNVGRRGHINLGSDLGEWQQGWDILRSYFA